VGDSDIGGDLAVYFGVVTAVTNGNSGQIVPQSDARYDWFARNVFSRDDTLSGVSEVPLRRIEDADVRVAPLGSPVIASYVEGKKQFHVLGEQDPTDLCE